MQEKPSFQTRSTKTSQLFIQIGVTARTHEQEDTAHQIWAKWNRPVLQWGNEGKINIYKIQKRYTVLQKHFYSLIQIYNLKKR